MARLLLPLPSLFLLLLIAGTAGADDGVSLFAGSAHGGDAQLHPGLAPLPCIDCTDIAHASLAADGAPPLVELGAAWIGGRGAARGGGELFTIVAAGDGASGYAGLVTFAGFEVSRLYLVGGLGLGSYFGGAHADSLDALAGNARAELGVDLARGWSLSARADLLKNNLSSSRVFTFGLAFAPSEWREPGR